MSEATQTLPVMESFYSVQGEGQYSGTPAYFIRLGGCDVGCVWCDVKDSWDAAKHPLVSVQQLADEAQKSGTAIVVVTGGEPAMYNLEELTGELKKRGLRTHIETSGAYPLSGHWDWITFSPKKFKAPVGSVYEVASELKVIAFNNSDLEWAGQHAQRVNKNCLLFIQPEWEKREKMTPLLFDFVRKHPEWRMSIQTHKYIGVD